MNFIQVIGLSIAMNGKFNTHLLTRYGFCKWNESKFSYWELIGWDITMNGNLKFVKFDGHYRITHRQDSFTWFFCATFFFAIIRSRHKYWTQEKKFKTFYISLACEYRFRYFVEYLYYQNMSVLFIIYSWRGCNTIPCHL